MIWENDHLLTTKEKRKLSNSVYNICKKYKVERPDYLVINKRLRAVDGLYNVYMGEFSDIKIEIVLALKHICKYGINSLDRVLRHEIAHHICFKRGYKIDHNDYFKDICLDVHGCLNEQYATGKYKNLYYEGIETSYKWRYICPNCGYFFKTKRKLNNSNYCAKCLKVKIENFIIWELKNGK